MLINFRCVIDLLLRHSSYVVRSQKVLHDLFHTTTSRQSLINFILELLIDLKTLINLTN